jgi:putative FmdB family regulatory protein
MPIYEYRCTKCGHSLEALQKMSDAPLRKCPACSRPALEKLVSAASFRLKGGGWYETDFKTGDKKQLADSDSGSVAASSEADTPKSAVKAPSESASKPTATESKKVAKKGASGKAKGKTSN